MPEEEGEERTKLKERKMTNGEMQVRNETVLTVLTERIPMIFNFRTAQSFQYCHIQGKCQ